MSSVGVFEAKAKLSELIDKALAGKQVVITRHGRAVARIVAEGAAGPKDVKAAIAEVRRYRRTLKTERIDLRALIAEGRR
jgi:prevent-host-death family protein